MKTCVWFSWIIFIVAIAALCLAWLRCKPIEAEWASILVGAIGSIAGSVIGWQIYNAIEMRNIINRISDLENGFTKSNQDLQAQDKRNMLLIEAFAKYSEAEKEKDSKATQYRAYAEALLLFLKANIAVGHEYMNNTKSGLSDALTALESKVQPLDKKLLIDHDSHIENTYDEIIDIIQYRKKELSDLKKLVKEFRDRRKSLVEKFNKELLDKQTKKKRH